LPANDPVGVVVDIRPVPVFVSGWNSQVAK
jgi:hypothetical protein